MVNPAPHTKFLTLLWRQRYLLASVPWEGEPPTAVAASGLAWLDPCLLASLDIRRTEITRVRQQRFGFAQFVR